MDCPEPCQIAVFFAKHNYFPEYKEWKDKGCTHLCPPHIYVTMPFNYPQDVFADPISAFESLWEDREEFCDDPNDRHEIAQMIECFELKNPDSAITKFHNEGTS